MFSFNGHIKFLPKQAPITCLILLICCILTMIMHFLGGFTKANHLTFGALDETVYDSFQFWRFLTYSFHHLNDVHFLSNACFFLLLSLPLERMMRKTTYVVTLIFLSTCAGLFTLLFSNYEYIVGLSGIIFGLLGMYFFIIMRYRKAIQTSDQRILFFAFMFGFILTFVLPHISLSCHIGGFIGGLLIAPFVINKRALRHLYDVAN